MLHLTPVRISVAIVLLIALDAPSVDAQTTLRGHLGVSGFTVVGGDAPGDRSAFAFPTAGLMVQRRLPVARQVAVEVGLFYVGKGATSDVQVRIDGGPPVPATTELRLAYLDIPILLRADFEPRTGVTLALLGGIAIEFLLDEGIEIITEDDSRTGVQTTENFNGNSFAGQLGAAVGIERYELGLRYHRSLSNVSSNAAEPVFANLRHSGVILSLSYRL